MSNRLIVLLLLIQSFLCASEMESGRLRIATYNVGNYNASGRMTDAGYRTDYPKSEESKTALRRCIAALDADVLVLQELGPEPYLQELRRDLLNCGLAYGYSYLALGPDGDRHLAVISKQPLKRVLTHARVEFNYLGAKEHVKRGLLEVVLDTAAGELTLWVVHLKSRFTDRKDDPDSNLRRAGEATALRDLILRRHGNPETALFLILGDFNDSKNLRPVRAFLERGKTPISELVRAADSRGHAWTHHNLKDDSYERFRSHTELPCPGPVTGAEKPEGQRP